MQNAVTESGRLHAGPGVRFNGAFSSDLIVDDFLLEYKMKNLSNTMESSMSIIEKKFPILNSSAREDLRLHDTHKKPQP